MRSKLILFYIGLLGIGSLSINAETLSGLSWREISKDERRKISVLAAKPVGERGLVPIRAKSTVEHDFVKVLTVLADTESKTKWLPNAVEAKTIERESLKFSKEYIRYSAPWPLMDRTFVFESRGYYDPKKKELKLTIQSIEHPKYPRNKEYVRGETLEGYLILKSKGKGQTDLDMAFLTDFKGSIPAWVINMVQKKWPYKFMKELRDRLDDESVKPSPIFEEIRRKNIRIP